MKYTTSTASSKLVMVLWYAQRGDSKNQIARSIGSTKWAVRHLLDSLGLELDPTTPQRQPGPK